MDGSSGREGILTGAGRTKRPVVAIRRPGRKLGSRYFFLPRMVVINTVCGATSRSVYLQTYCMGQTGFSPSNQWRWGIQDSSWQMFTPPIKDLFMIGETDSVLIGSYSWQGSLYRSTDQGAYWEAIPPDYGRVYNTNPFFYWPDGLSLVSDFAGWHLKKDSAALYRYLPDVENNCVGQTVQRADSVFWACPALYEGGVLPPTAVKPGTRWCLFNTLVMKKLKN